MQRHAWTPIVRALAVAIVLSLGACLPTAPAPSPTVGPDRLSQGASAVPSAAAGSSSPPPTSMTAMPMGAAPEGCPGPVPRPTTVADFIGPVVLGPPLWAGPYASYDTATNAYSAPDAPHTEHGWRIKILFLLEPGHDSVVDLVGEGVEATDGAVVFAIENSAPSTVATFDPAAPGIPVQHNGWREYPTYAYFPAAGCYRLTATWTGGSSQVGFGLGGGATP